jgi:CheY-like chemotaxis protein
MALRAEELERVNAELRELDRAKDGFLTNVSHELRTPLSTVRGYAEMFASGSLGPLEPEQAKGVDVIHRNVQRLEFLIEEMLDFSRMQIQGLKLDRRLVNVANMLTEAGDSLEPSLARKAMRIETGWPADLPPAWCDRNRVGQVLGILLSNAFKFSPEGGVVRLTAETRPPRTLVVHVADAGIGIEPAHQKRIFDKFFQVDSSMTRRYEGAGIGLSIAKSIAEAHGGHLELESAAGEGSTFSLVLPDSLMYPCGGAELTAERQNCLHALHIIVIDDTVESRETLAGVLREAGCTVAEKRGTFDGFRLASQQAPAVVLLPDTMSDLASSQAATVWNEQFAEPGAGLVLLLSEHASDDVLLALRAAGASWLHRPFSFDDLAEKLCDTESATFGESGISADEA